MASKCFSSYTVTSVCVCGVGGSNECIHGIASISSGVATRRRWYKEVLGLISRKHVRGSFVVAMGFATTKQAALRTRP